MGAAKPLGGEAYYFAASDIAHIYLPPALPAMA